MPKTYEPIATQVLESSQANITFSSIPQTYTDLILIVNGRITTSTINPDARVNSDTGTNYSFTEVAGSGSAASSSRSSTINYLRLASFGYLDTVYATNLITQFMNYSNTTTYKTIISRGNNAGNGTSLVANLWRSTAAISSIVLVTGTYSAGSTFTLYGIKAA